MNREHVIEILAHHTKWAKYEGGGRANFVGANLRGANLRGVNLSTLDLTEIVLRRADLSGADLTTTTLKKSDLNDANFTGATLQRSSVIMADAHNANFTGADLRSVDMKLSYLVGAIFLNANMENINLEGIVIDDESAALIPEDIQEKFQKTWTIIKTQSWESPKKPYIIRSIVFPPEYHEAGMSILSYFGTIIREKYNDPKIGITITQEGYKVTLKIDSPDGNMEEYKETLEQYARVVAGKEPPDTLLSDPLQVLELKNRLERAELELKHSKEFSQFKENHYGKRIGTFENEIIWMRKLVGGVLSQSGKSNESIKLICSKALALATKATDKLEIVINSLSEQNENVCDELCLLKDKLIKSNPSEEDKREVKKILSQIKTKEPDNASKIFVSICNGVSSSIWTNILMEMTRMVC